MMRNIPTFLEACSQVLDNIGKKAILDKNIPRLINLLDTTGQYELNEDIPKYTSAGGRMWIWVKNVVNYYQAFHEVA